MIPIITSPWVVIRLNKIEMFMCLLFATFPFRRKRESGQLPFIQLPWPYHIISQTTKIPIQRIYYCPLLPLLLLLLLTIPTWCWPAHNLWPKLGCENLKNQLTFCKATWIDRSMKSERKQRFIHIDSLWQRYYNFIKNGLRFSPTTTTSSSSSSSSSSQETQYKNVVNML